MLLLSARGSFLIGLDSSRQIDLILSNLLIDTFEGLGCGDRGWAIGIGCYVCLLYSEAAAEELGVDATDGADVAC